MAVVLHPLTDDRRILPLERTGEQLTAPASFMLVVSYNPGYQNLLRILKPCTRQRFVAIEFDFLPKAEEIAVVSAESGLAESKVAPLAELARQPNRKKLLLVLTDGKPNDLDHYEGRFALEDSRRAVIEARRCGLGVFGVTVDREAKSYVPALFGQNGYAMVGNIAKLPAALPAIYRSLAG